MAWGHFVSRRVVVLTVAILVFATRVEATRDENDGTRIGVDDTEEEHLVREFLSAGSRLITAARERGFPNRSSSVHAAPLPDHPHLLPDRFRHAEMPTVHPVTGDRIGISKTLAFAFCIAVFLGIACAYRQHGFQGISLILSYIASIIACQILVKLVINEFPYPLTIASCHFVSYWICLAGVQAFKVHAGHQKVKFPWTSKWWYLVHIGSICLPTYLAIVLHNASLIYISAGLSMIISLFTPVFTAVVAAGFGMPIALIAWFGMLVALAGDFLSTWDVIRNAPINNAQVRLIGISLAIGSMMCRAIKHVLNDRLMNPYQGSQEGFRLDPLDLWSLQVPCFTFLSLVGSFSIEGVEPFRKLHLLGADLRLYLLLSCIAAWGLTIGAIMVIKLLGAPAAQIAGKFNVLIAVAFCGAFLDELVTRWEVVGALLIILGVWIFDVAQAQGDCAYVESSKDALASKATSTPNDTDR